MTTSHTLRFCAALAACTLVAPSIAQQVKQPHNVIVFVADGLRRGSVNPTDMPAFARLRANGTDFRNSHSVFPTFTTANASAIATGHGLGDTGDFSNVIYTGVYNTQLQVSTSTGSIVPFLESDEVLADLNSYYDGNYLNEQTILTAARLHGMNVASIGKLGPVAIQQADQIARDLQYGGLKTPAGIVIDDSTGQASGFPLSGDILDAINKVDLAPDAPTRSNGYSDASPSNNGFSGDAITPGTRLANGTQEQWFTDVTTQVVLPKFAADKKPFVLLFWSRDPDGTQHNEGDSLQNLAPGINGDTSNRALHNADHCLQQLLDWLDAHPSIKANTDVILTSDHGFATITRRIIAADGTQTGEPSASLPYEYIGKDKPEPAGTLPPGFLAIDLALWSHQRLFDPAIRATSGDSVYEEVVLSGEKAHHPSNGSGLIGDRVTKLDGSDARIIVAANGGSDLIYIPSHDPKLVHETLATLTDLDYVGAIFVDDDFCKAPTDCPGALPLSSIGLKGATHLPTPAIVVGFKVFYRVPGDLQTAEQVSDTTLQTGQGMHGGFGRDSTWNNMAAIGPDFKAKFVDEQPVGNIDIAPTIAHILGFDLESKGSIKGRAATEAFASAPTPTATKGKTLISAPATNGKTTILEYQQSGTTSYFDRACFIKPAANSTCAN